MHTLEFYSLRLDGNRVNFASLDNPALVKAVGAWAGKGTSIKVESNTYEQQYIAGHEDNLLCRVFRKVNGAGGFVVVFDGTGALLVAYADTNLELVAGAGHFARMATYIRYGADIFEHGDEED